MTAHDSYRWGDVLVRRGRRLLDRAPWLAPLCALLVATVLLIGVGIVGPRLAPRISAPPTPAPTATAVESTAYPSGYPTPAPINYGFYDWSNVDYQKLYPGAGPVGSLAVFAWRRIHINDGQFDWQPIESYLEAAQAMTVTLDDGTVIPKPVIVEILDSESAIPSRELSDAPYPPLTQDSPYFFFDDFTPPWIRDRLRKPIQPITYVTALNPRQVSKLDNDLGSYLAINRPTDSFCTFPAVAIAPEYGSEIWQKYYKQMVYALGQRYDQDPRVTAIVFGPGIDGEFGQATKPQWGCDFKNMLYQQSGMPERDYLATVVKAGTFNDIADWYRAAFPHKPVFLQFTDAGKSTIDTLDAENLWPPIGLKQATLTQDNNNQWQTDNAGTIQLMTRYSTTHPIAWENAYAYTGGYPRNMQVRYFTLLAGLTSFPAFMDFIGGWPIEAETVATGMFDFQRRYLGRTITTTDEVWVAMRDTDYWPPIGGAIQFGGWHGDFSYGLYRPDGIAGNATVVITSSGLTGAPYKLTYPITTSLFSLIARRTDAASGNSYMSFTADQRWPYKARVPYAVSPSGAWYDVTLKYVDQGSDPLAVEYKDYAGVTRTRTIRKRDTGQWVTTTLTLQDAHLNGGLPGGADLRINAVPGSGGNDEIVHMVMIKGHLGGQPTATPAPVRATRTPAPLYEQRLIAGGNAYVDHSGYLWNGDQPYAAGSWGYVAGNVYTATLDVTNVPDPTLYKTERWWQDRGGYRFDVPNGAYQVELYFAEGLRSGQQQRLFDVQIEGVTVLQNFDLFATGGFNKGFVQSFQTTVSDGQLTVDFTTRRDSAKVNAIHVLYVVPRDTPTVTATPGPATATPVPATVTPTVTPGTPGTTPTVRSLTPTPAATPSDIVTGTPTATPTLTIEQQLMQAEDRYQHLLDIVNQIMQMIHLP
jgi:hypothetical protein